MRTSEICAILTLKPGFTKNDLIGAIKAGCFCWGEVTDPDTGNQIAAVVHVDVENVDDDGIVVEE